MTHHQVAGDREQLSKAHAQMTESLRILDELEAPGDIGSHLDLAISRLEQHLKLHGHGPASADLLFPRLGMDPHVNDDSRRVASDISSTPAR